MTTYAYIASQPGSTDFQTQYQRIISFASENWLQGPIETKFELSTFLCENRPMLSNLITDLCREDSIIVADLTSFGDTTLEIMAVLSRLSQKGVKVYVIKGGFRIEDSMTAMSVAMGYSLVSQIETELESQRTTSEMALEPQTNIKPDHPLRRIRKSRLDAKVGEIRTMLRDGASLAEIARAVESNRQTVADFINSRQLAP